ncbi:hypothetical protein SNEBB_004428 [Seison nebaliae]|nr:hypothetical protein SNEBB_004428 [Seison nebaliae]
MHNNNNNNKKKNILEENQSMNNSQYSFIVDNCRSLLIQSEESNDEMIINRENSDISILSSLFDDDDDDENKKKNFPLRKIATDKTLIYEQSFPTQHKSKNTTLLEMRRKDLIIHRIRQRRLEQMKERRQFVGRSYSDTISEMMSKNEKKNLEEILDDCRELHLNQHSSSHNNLKFPKKCNHSSPSLSYSTVTTPNEHVNNNSVSWIWKRVRNDQFQPSHHLPLIHTKIPNSMPIIDGESLTESDFEILPNSDSTPPPSPILKEKNRSKSRPYHHPMKSVPFNIRKRIMMPLVSTITGLPLVSDSGRFKYYLDALSDEDDLSPNHCDEQPSEDEKRRQKTSKFNFWKFLIVPNFCSVLIGALLMYIYMKHKTPKENVRFG